MSEGLNRVILLGHLGGEPELRYTQTGTAVLNMSLATNETFLDRNKEKQARTDWHRVVVWGTRAEGLSKILTKGQCVLVEGGLRTSSFEHDGLKRTRTEVHAREICLAGRKGGAPFAGHDEISGHEDTLPSMGAAGVSNGAAGASNGAAGASNGAARSAPMRRPSTRAALLEEMRPEELPY